jgi:hypothetical protein
VAAAAIPLLHALIPRPLPLELRVLAALPGTVACVLWWQYFRAQDYERLPFLPYAVTQIYVYWGLAAMTTDVEDLASAGPRAWAGAVIAACVVMAGFLVTHPVGKALGACAASPLERCLPRTAPRITALIALPWLALAAAVNADVLIRILPPSVHNLAQTVGDYSPLLAAIAWRDLRGRRGSGWLVGCTVPISLAGLLTGMMQAAVQPVLLSMMLYVVLRRRVPWRLLAAGLLLVVIINPAKTAYREEAWQDDQTSRGEHAERSVTVAAERWWRALKSTWGGDPQGPSHASTLASRLNELSINAVVLDRTPAAIPFDGGRSWGYMAVSLVPRFLYPEKPNFTEVYNDRFSVTFGFQSPSETDNSTGAFPLVSDGYWNLGWPGVVLVGVVAGLLIGIFAGLFRARSWAPMAMAAATLARLHANDPLALQVIGVPQAVLGLAVLLWAAWLVFTGAELLRAGRVGDPAARGA